MRSYDTLLEEENGKLLEELAKEKGLTIDQLVNEIVYDHLVNSNRITRFVAKRGPKK